MTALTRQARSWRIAPALLLVVVAWLGARGAAAGTGTGTTRRTAVAPSVTALDPTDDDHGHGHGPHPPSLAAAGPHAAGVVWRAHPGPIAAAASGAPDQSRRLLRRVKIPSHGDDVVPPA